MSLRGPRRLAALIALLAMAFAAPSSFARDDAQSDGMKQYWQNRYRQLLRSADELRAEIAHETELYADANRRNYRRGTKRHMHRVAAEEAKAKLDAVESKLSTIKDEGRRAGALPGWFYEVEEEREDIARNPSLGPRKGLMSRVRAYLSECLVSVVWETLLELPIRHVTMAEFIGTVRSTSSQGSERSQS